MPLPEDVDMTVREFYSGFNLDFMTEEEKQTIYTATELFAKGKVRAESQASRERIRELEATVNELMMDDMTHEYNEAEAERLRGEYERQIREPLERIASLHSDQSLSVETRNYEVGMVLKEIGLMK